MQIESNRGGVFDAERAETLVEAGADHWWFRSKAAFVGQMLRITARDSSPVRLLDLGAGTGDVTALVRPHVGTAIVVEGSEALARHAHARHQLCAAVATIEQVPVPSGAVDVVALLDVIEHLVDPVPALVEARRLVGPGGRVVVTVPAHPRLWSVADEFLGHQRRYTRRRLREHLRRAGFEVAAVTHVFSWLVLPVWWRRRDESRIDEALGVSANSPTIAWVARVLTGIERRVLRWVSLPIGTTVIGVGRVGSDVDA